MIPDRDDHPDHPVRRRGPRLWPASRESYPKQFLPLAGDKTLLQDTVLRVSDPARFDAPIVVTNHEHRFIVAEQMEQIGVKAPIVLEPCRRDIGGGARRRRQARRGARSDAVALALASDHVITDQAGFPARRRNRPGCGQCRQDRDLRAEADRADVEIRLYPRGAPRSRRAGRRRDRGVHRKAHRAEAEALIAEGCYWNSGNFLGLARMFIGELSGSPRRSAGPPRCGRRRDARPRLPAARRGELRAGRSARRSTTP